MSVDKFEIKDRVLAALVGFAVGDAKGWYHTDNNNRADLIAESSLELLPWERFFGDKFDVLKESINAGAYGNLTYFMLGACRNVINGGTPADFISHELKEWSLYKREPDEYLSNLSEKKYGQVKTKEYWKTRSDGTSVVRCIPLAIRAYIEDKAPDLLMKDVALDCMSTHGRASVILASQLYAYMIYSILKNGDEPGDSLLSRIVDDDNIWGTFQNGSCPYVYNEEEEKIKEEFEKQVHQFLTIMGKIGCPSQVEGNNATIMTNSGCCNKAKPVLANVIAAFYLAAVQKNNPYETVMTISLNTKRNLVNISEISALTGCLFGISGAFTDGLAEWKWKIQDYSFMEKIAEILVSSDMKSMRDGFLKNVNTAAGVTKKSFIGDLTEVPMDIPDENKMIEVRRSPLGQTFYYEDPSRLFPEKLIIALNEGWDATFIKYLNKYKIEDVAKALILLGSRYRRNTLFPDDKKNLDEIKILLDRVFKESGCGFKLEKELNESAQALPLFEVVKPKAYIFEPKMLLNDSGFKKIRSKTVENVIAKLKETPRTPDCEKLENILKSVFKPFEAQPVPSNGEKPEYYLLVL